jgi:hypothetical protein
VGRKEVTETENYVIKKLKSALGRLVGPSEWAPLPSVIGSVEQAPGRNTIVRVGKMTIDDPDERSGSWTQTEHIALKPSERDELIDVLSSHQECRTVKIGDTVGAGYVVMGVHYVNATADPHMRTGTALAWNDRKREYAVFTIDARGNADNGLYREDSQRALNAYTARMNDHLFRHFNSTPPTLTYAAVPERDRLTVTS